MASLARDPNGRKRILFVAQDGKRKTIRLGKTSIKQAEAFKLKLEALITGRFSGSIDPETARWIADLPDDIHTKLVAVGLLTPRASNPELNKYTVRQWANKYIESRSDVSEDTRGKMQNVANKLSSFFKEQPIDTITINQAKEYRIHLKSALGLAENTVRRQIGRVREFFNAAVEAEIINKNPFKSKGQPVTVRANKARFFYVTQEMALKVLEACPDTQWRLIFGLARWGGLRCPSEILRLKWQDVDFEHSRFIVHASKTAHHADGGIRTVPMFPELRQLFQDAFDQAQEGDVYCITRYREQSVNLRTQLSKIIRRAGLEPWAKLFQNMRSTRETELFKLTNGNVKAVCTWIGNSPKVAMEHYAQVTEADLQEAAKMTLLNEAEEAAQNAAQYLAAQKSTERKVIPDKNPKNTDLPLVTASCNSVQELSLPGTGFEPARDCSH